ncbi:hypothetical protein [Pseudomonas sp. DSP3-2-2]|uniref:8-oxoguanine DNA glycosylase OGG fold protein n=1 Tax=unclassified Pseudomonas TaxID=196821 RepID=UPI003CFA0797
MIPPFLPSQVSHFQQLYAHKALTPWVGASPHSWAESVYAGLGKDYGLSTGQLTRAALRALWADPCVSDEACFLSTMAWGGMQRGNGRRSWASRSHWLPVCKALRDGIHSRATGFSAFSMLRAQGKLPGMGPAYFTKILFFAEPNADAYILDQWTARSIHILSGQGAIPAVRKDYASSRKASELGTPSKLRLIVDDKVTVADYLDYCRQVERLGEMLDLHPHQVEEQLFSAGGKSPHPWRDHVMKAWVSPTSSLYR